MSTSDAEEDGYLNIFKEPEGFYEPEKEPTYVSYETVAGQNLSLRLVGHSPLWGHLLWNAGRTLAHYLETHASTLIANKTVLELGAGAGLPSLICALHGAKQVLATDYPEPELIANLRQNIVGNAALLATAATNGKEGVDIAAEGYLWGSPTSNLTAYLSPEEREAGFDLLILGDLLFNHSEHRALLSTVQHTLKKTAEARALVFFTPYRPWLLEKDMAFLDLVREAGMVVEKVLETLVEGVMFTDDPGDERVRRTVFGFEVRWGAL